ncbi:MAG TPA: ATP-grasp domain-containing protein [Verrucomicrobiae bacterium]
MQAKQQTSGRKEFNSGNNLTAAPRVLLAENSGWSVVAVLAVRLAKVGIHVSAVCPAHNPLLKTRAVSETFPYSALHPLDSLAAAIEAARPDFIIPCDDRAVPHVHELHARARLMGEAGRALAALIEKSLGSPESYPVVSSRYDLLRIAREEGLRVPDTEEINSESDLEAWQRQHAFPWVLKADTTGNGRGVRFVQKPGQSSRFLAELIQFYGLGRAIKRLFVNRDPFWVRPWWNGVKPAVIAQSYIQGRPANCGVLCWRGKILAGIGVEVFSETEAMAHASVVRVVDNPDMMLCAERIARRLNLSGFFGLDFMIEEGTGLTYLIEMNPRPTRLSSLRLGTGRDPIGAIYAQLSGQQIQSAPPVTRLNQIAYFPEVAEPGAKLLESCYHDVPEGEPELMRQLQRPWPTETVVWRLIDAVKLVKQFVRNHALKRSSVPHDEQNHQADKGALAHAKILD